MQTPSTIARLLSLAFLFGCLVILPGCSGAGDISNAVTGKVTMDDKPVAGMVVFVGPDNKEIIGAISPDGQYVINAPQKGKNKIAIKGMAMGVGNLGTQKKGVTTDKGKEATTTTDKMAAVGSGVQPPKKYENPENGLFYDVKGTGKEEHDIKLEKK